MASCVVNDDPERRPLLADPQEAGGEASTVAKAIPEPEATDWKPQSLIVDSILKLRCFVYILALIAVGFIAALIETETFVKHHNGTAKPHPEFSNATSHVDPKDLVCWAVKCAYPITAVVAIFYLQKVVLVPGKIREAYVHYKAQPGRRVIFKNVYRLIKMPSGLGAYPSALYVGTYIIFTLPYFLSGGIEIVCGIIDSVNPGKTERALIEIVRRALLIVFTAMQTRLFFVNYRQCIQWRLSASWICGCHLLATNIAAWFFNVGLEVRELVPGNHSEFSNDSYCAQKSINKISTFLYPFVIEYYVMSALMAFTLVTNTGRLGTYLQSHIHQLVETMDATGRLDTVLRGELHSRTERKESEFATLRKYPSRFAIGILFVVIALTVSIFVGLNHDNRSNKTMLLIFYCVLVLLYSCGLVCIVILLCSLNKSSKQQISTDHLADRLLLWLGAAAISINDLYTFWITWTMLSHEATVEVKVNHILLATSCALNICQSLSQVYALECALIRKFPTCRLGRANYEGRALLNVLILLNIAEWIVNTVCFSFFFPMDQMENALVLSLMTMPLQVFYRFHSAACIHDFKQHCEVVEAEDSPPLSLPPPSAEAEAAAAPDEAAAEQHRHLEERVVNFPNMPSLLDSVLSFEYGKSPRRSVVQLQQVAE